MIIREETKERKEKGKDQIVEKEIKALKDVENIATLLKLQNT